MATECPSAAWDRYHDQHEYYCEVCEKHFDDCYCLLCPWCGEHGNPECLIANGKGCDEYHIQTAYMGD